MSNNKKKNKSDHLVEKINFKIKRIFIENPGEEFTARQLAKRLSIRDSAGKEAIRQSIYLLEKDKAIIKASRVSYRVNLEAEEDIIGTVDFVNPRFAYIISSNTDTDTVVKVENLKGALDQDTVKIKLFPARKKKDRREGEVIEILKRSKKEFVGRVELSEHYAFVIPDGRKMHEDIYVSKKFLGDAKANDKVIVELIAFPEVDKNPEGKVVRVLGKAGENEAEIHSIMAEFGLPFEFPEKVMKQANKMETTISKEDIKGRKDMRDVLTFTIDPHDAKDFDDALSFKDLGKGEFEIGIHIADVTHYVKPNSFIEEEGLERATSVYLVDRTIPMLPEKLSNELCSLRPNEDKLTFSAIFVMDESGFVKDRWFGRTIIHSDKRFTYEDAQEILEASENQNLFSKELHQLNRMAKELRKERFVRGAVNFETIEVKFDLDEQGKPLGIIPKIRKDSHKLVEEFMLLANREVATFIYNKKSGKGEPPTFVYRTHDNPDQEKLDTFSKFAARFGHQMKTVGQGISKSLNALIEKIEGRPEQNVLQSLAIRTMAKAKYTTKPDPHFGLAFMHYTHFTSPIRRYPDMMVHRLLFHYLSGGKSVDQETYEDHCIHSSEREKRAADAERASIKYKQVEYMEQVRGKTFEGIISGVTEWGIYVEIIETKCEGMVRIGEIDDDFYEFDEKNYRLIGKRKKRILQLGDKVDVNVLRTDIDRRTIDLDLVKHYRQEY